MAERIMGSSSVIAQQGMSERNRAAMNEGGERSVVAEFMDAARSSAESLLEEQKRQIADRVHGFADALEGAARSLHVSQNRMIGRYVQDAVTRLEALPTACTAADGTNSSPRPKTLRGGSPHSLS